MFVHLALKEHDGLLELIVLGEDAADELSGLRELSAAR